MSSLSLEVARRVEQLELPFNAAGLDPYGVSKRHLRQAGEAMGLAYKKYFHVTCHGVANVPARGRAMLVGNHSGGYSIDASMLAAACFFEMNPPRLAHGMADRFINKLPFLSTWASRVGQFTGLPEHARRLLRDERLLMTFPEGTRGTAKLYRERHQLVRFGMGFMRLALETRSPIIPVAVLGGGEAVPTVKNIYSLGRILGLPYVPLTPYLLAVPLPAHIDIQFGTPMHFEGNGQEPDHKIQPLVDQVRDAIAALIDRGKKDYSPI
jgi:1-acyl-sn-glycerol-3-phosphate acyltransferase